MWTVKEASRLFGIPKATLYDYIRANKLRVLQNPLGKGMVILEDEVEKLYKLSQFYKAKKGVK